MIADELHRSGSFWAFLLSIDKDLATLFEQLGPRCLIVRAEPQRGAGSACGRPFPVPHGV